MVFEFINNIGPAVIAGLFGIIMYKLQVAETSRKESRAKQNERMEQLEKNVAFINNIGPAVIAGLFGIIMYKLQVAETSRKESRAKQNERMEQLEKNVATLTEQVKDLAERADLKKTQLTDLKTVVEKIEKAMEVH